jgi:hypothetical protein
MYRIVTFFLFNQQNKALDQMPEGFSEQYLLQFLYIHFKLEVNYNTVQ